MPPPKHLHPVWRSYRCSLYLVIAGTVGFLACAALALVAPTDSPAVGVLVAASMAAVIVGGMRVLLFRCPNCGKQFHLRNGYGWSWPLNYTCRRCAFPRWHDPPADRWLLP